MTKLDILVAYCPQHKVHLCNDPAVLSASLYGKGEKLTNKDANTFVHTILEKSFVRMEHSWDLLFQLMKHGTNTLHVAFIFLLSIVTPQY